MHSGFLQSGKCVGLRSMDSLFTKTKTASANADVSQLFIVTRTHNYPLTVSRARYFEPSLGRVTVRLCFQPHPTFKWGKKKTNHQGTINTLTASFSLKVKRCSSASKNTQLKSTENSIKNIDFFPSTEIQIKNCIKIEKSASSNQPEGETAVTMQHLLHR